MITIFHNGQKIIRVEGIKNRYQYKNTAIGVALFDLALLYPTAILTWCHMEWEWFRNKTIVPQLIHHKKIMVSYRPYQSNVLNDGLGYIDNGSILKVKKDVAYFSWQMSSCIGAISAAALNEISGQVVDKAENLDYLLNSIAKRAMPLGLFCYSEPLLLHNCPALEKGKTSSNFTLFKFVKQHYATKWSIVLLVSFLLNEKKLLLLPWLYSLFFKRRYWDSNCLNAIAVKSNKKVVVANEIDIVIPTIGRADYLKNVLYDLKNQTHLPKKVVIVEQNPMTDSQSELDFISQEKWPFVIESIFTHQAGACNARNIALSKVTAEWVFLADDDIRIQPDFLKEAITNCEIYGIESAIFSCLLVGEKESCTAPHQTTIFGSGCSIVKKDALKRVQFNNKYEFAYGEDFDFGMQLRNSGTDVVYFPKPEIVHLKAPIGGFRIKPSFEWDTASIVPKPAPTIMLNNVVYKTKQQIFGYKLVYFRQLFMSNWKLNPILFYKRTNAHWNASWEWAKKLQDND